MREYDVAIIGGGLTGLSAAYYLSKEEKKVIVLEKNEEVGGLVSSWNRENYKIEKFYHHISKNDDFFPRFLKELRIEKRLKWKVGSVGYYYKGKVYKMDTPFEILKFKGLNLVDIIKITLVLLQVKVKRDYSDLDEISAKDWLTKKNGEHAYNNFFKPLLKGKFGKNLNEVSAAWLFGRIKFRSNRSFSGEKLGYMESGFHELIEKMCEEIENNGGQILTNVKINKIKIEKDHVSGLESSSGDISTHNVISTLPPKELLKICKLPIEYENRLRKIEYQHTVCVLFGLNKNLLEKVYWLNIKSDTLPFGAIIEHTNFHDIPEYGEDHLVYVVSYVQDANDQLWKKEDEEIINIYIDGLRVMFSDFEKDSIKWWRVAKGLHTSPIYKIGYYNDITGLDSPISGLFITGMFLMYPERSMSDALKLGKEIASKIK